MKSSSKTPERLRSEIQAIAAGLRELVDDPRAICRRLARAINPATGKSYLSEILAELGDAKQRLDGLEFEATNDRRRRHISNREAAYSPEARLAALSDDERGQVEEGRRLYADLMTFMEGDDYGPDFNLRLIAAHEAFRQFRKKVRKRAMVELIYMKCNTG